MAEAALSWAEVMRRGRESRRRKREFGRGTDAQPCGDGGVMSSLIGFSFLMEVDLEMCLPLTDSAR